MSIIGQSLVEGVHLPVPRLFRSIVQTFFGPQVTTEFKVTESFRSELEQALDPADPTRVFAKYQFDWWNNEQYWYAFEVGDELEKAYYFHRKTVSLYHYGLHSGLRMYSIITMTASRVRRRRPQSQLPSFRPLRIAAARHANDYSKHALIHL